MVAHKSFELADELVVATEHEVGLDPVLVRGEPQVVEPRGLVCRGRVEDEVG